MDSSDLFRRQTAGLQTWQQLLSNPFQSQIVSTSFYAALIWSFAVSTGLFLLFCLLRPYTSNIYAPRAKHADQKHKPPQIGKGFFSWIEPIRTVKEHELIEKTGLDAVVFLRFLRMLRNIFIIMTAVGCGVLIPITLNNFNNNPSSSTSDVGYSKRQYDGGYDGYDGSGDASDQGTIQYFVRMTPQYIYGTPFWAYVVVAYVFNFIVFFFVWWNYRAVTNLRRMYFESTDYRHSLHSRTLILTSVPSTYRTEEGMVELVQRAKPTQDVPKIAVGRALRDLPDLIEDHKNAVHKLERYLAKYLANPNALPANRPVCKPERADKQYKGSGNVDAIDYYTGRIQYLENAVRSVRASVDRRNPLAYGFASYTHVEDAHSVAYATRRKGPKGTTIKLAPKPTDILWSNLAMSTAARRSKTAWNGFWIVVLTILYVPPNILISVFLVNLHNLGKVWPQFQESLYAHPTGWSLVQGILAPLLNLLIYMALPLIFRRMLNKAGDTTRTQRERHVTSKLYAFTVFNNLFVFSIFSTVAAFVTGVIGAQNANVWDSIKDGHLAFKIAIGLCQFSPYWISWQLQRNLLAAVDILQAWPLVRKTFLKRFTKPTPRQLVELSAPPTMDYADYYYQYLFVATVGIAFSALQPLILPITAFYLGVDVWLKKYLLQYVTVTKVESGGAFWRMLINRVLFAVLLMDAVIALLVGALGIASEMLYAMIPLLIILPLFKWFVSRSFDTKMNFYTTKSFSEGEAGGTSTPGAEKKLKRHQDRVAVKYGHPALYKKLITPMVHAKAQHLMKQVYGGRVGGSVDATQYEGRPNSVFGYSDIYMGEMDNERPGKMYHSGADAQYSGVPFEMVGDNEMDFENFKRRADFRYEHGGDGELYGRPDDSYSRPTTPSSMMSFGASTLLGRDSRRNSEVALNRYPSADQLRQYNSTEALKQYANNGSSEVLAQYPSADQLRQHNSSDALRQYGQDPGEAVYPRGYNVVGPSSREASPARASSHLRDYSGSRGKGYSPISPEEPYVGVDIPTPGLETGNIQAAGQAAYHLHQPTPNKRSSMGSLGGMLDNAAMPERSATPLRKPVPSSARPGGFGAHQHGYSNSGGSSGNFSAGYASPQQAYSSPQHTPYDDNTSYDYFRRGRM